MSELQEIFNACLNVPAFQREELLGRLCGQNESLRRRVQRLLEFDQENQDTGFLEPKDPAGLGWANRAVGSCIGPYQLTGLVGVGGFGAVYRAQRTADSDVGRTERTDRDLEEKPPLSDRQTSAGVDDPHVYAVKILHPWLVNTSAFERFRREERALRSVNHPHVARYIDSGIESGGSPYLVTAFVEGVSLEQRVCHAQGQADVTAIPITTRVGWLIDICHGVQAAHERLILHRDLKPSNILISHDDRAVVTDFGIAKHLASNEGAFTSGQGLLGTVHFMAPEQLDRQAELGLSADIYGIGGLAYFLLTGNPPHSIPIHSVGGDRPRIEPPKLPRQVDASIPADLETICLKCLHHEPERRYAAADLVAEELSRFLNSEPIMARPVGYLEAARYWMRRNVVLTRIIGLSLLGTLVAIGAIIYLWQQATRETERAEQNMQTALASYQTLRDVIDRFMNSLRIAEQNPATTRLQLELLTDLSQAYDRLAEQSEPDNELLRDHAVCLFKLGTVQKQLNQTEAHWLTIEKAEAMFLELARWEPDNPQHWFDVFHCRNDLRRMSEALEAIERVCTLDQGRSLDYLDALAHIHLRMAEAMLVEPNSLAQVVQLCEKAGILAEKNLQSDPSHWRYRKKMAEVLCLEANIAAITKDYAGSFIRIEQGNKAYRHVLAILPKDREVLRLMWLNLELKFSIEALGNDWDAANRTVERMCDLTLEYQAADSRNVNHFLLKAWSYEALVFVACMDERHEDAVAYGLQWQEAIDDLVADFPEVYFENLEKLKCDACLHRLYPTNFSAERIGELSTALKEIVSDTKSSELLPMYLAVVWYLLGDFDACRRNAEEIIEPEDANVTYPFNSIELARFILAKLAGHTENENSDLVVASQPPEPSAFELPHWRYQFFRYLLER